VSDPVLDALAESARNRGLKLVRSRVRTPGKRRFGKAGLTDATNKPVFGMDTKGPTAKPEEVAGYLRILGTQDWDASLGEQVPTRKPNKKAAPSSKPPPKPKPAPMPQVRAAKPADAPAAVALAALLGAELDETAVRKRIAALTRDEVPPLVASLDRKVVGLCVFGRIATLHRDRPTGHVTLLAVAEQARRQGIGRMLLEAAEALLADIGCGRVEIAVGDARLDAQGFYRSLGYQRTSIRFAKPL
jgi:ribosomal protein S18 acetylase RimI-like enzyme